MTETTWFWVGTTGMALGALVVLGVAKQRTQDEEAHKVVHVLVCLVAASSYLSMAFGQGGIEIGGRTFWYARYLDWSVTTPLLLLGLCMTALHGAHRRPALVAAVLGADVLMIVTGLLSGLSADPTHRFAWFLVSTGAFLALYVALFGPLRREAALRDHERHHAYVRNAALLGGLWGIYPVVVALGPHGAEVITSTTRPGSSPSSTCWPRWSSASFPAAPARRSPTATWAGTRSSPHRSPSTRSRATVSGRSAGPPASGRRPRRRSR